jgi:predicted nucleic acid-binding protein
VIAVSDSSPLVILAKLASFDLVRSLFAKVYISEEVRREVVEFGAGLPGALEVERADWIETKQILNPTELLMLRERHPLGLGELSAILLAKEVHANTILLDDHNARRLAQVEGLQVLGTVGVLETAYLKGHLADLRAAFAQLLTHSYIDKRLLNSRLRSFRLSPL